MPSRPKRDGAASASRAASWWASPRARPSRAAHPRAWAWPAFPIAITSRLTCEPREDFSRPSESLLRTAPSKRDKEATVMTALITMSLLSLLFLGPLVWRLWRDRLESRALELQGEIQAAI